MVKSIKETIKKLNINDEIKWTVNKTKVGYTVSNNYDETVKFTIKVLDDNSLVIKNYFEETVGYVIVGDDRWSDCKSLDEAIVKASRMIVNHFYSCY